MRKLIILLSVVALIIGAYFYKNGESPQVTIDNYTYNIEVASTEVERETGLMNRKHLNANSGMLFVFQVEAEQSFWNKDTLIPLDVVWILNGKVTGISSLPAIDEGLETVTSPTLVNYALELSSGTAARNGIHIGSEVEIRL